MMQWRLSNLQGEYKQKTGKTLSIRKIASDTGLSKTTIATMAKGDVQRPDERIMTTLLVYLSKMLNRKLVTNDLWQFTDIPISVTDHTTVTDEAHVEIVTPKP